MSEDIEVGATGGSRSRLFESVQYMKGVGPVLAGRLSKGGISTLEDVLYFLPKTYQDRSKITPIRNLEVGQSATVFGTVVSAHGFGRGRVQRFQADIQDPSGRMRLVWFRAHAGLKTELVVGAQVLVFGEVAAFGAIFQMTHPELEVVRSVTQGKPASSLNFGRVVPVYVETDGLHQRTIRRLTSDALRLSLPELSDPLPEGLRRQLGLKPLRESFVEAHYPQVLPDESALPEAVRRIAFEEFFVLELGLLLRRRALQRLKAPVLVDSLGRQQELISGLPFKLTQDQRDAMVVIQSDLAQPHPMRRLVQGDVGSGKTVVALASSAIAIAAGYQVVLMAPTEVLAEQHRMVAERLFGKLGIRCELLVQRTSRDEVLARVQNGEAQLVIGTHAVFQKKVVYSKLGLVIIDEQHRFGVEQRMRLLEKASEGAHLLMMTATPIPRTLALTLYGDLDVTTIREKPAGRKPVVTEIVTDRKRPAMYEMVRQAVREGSQVFVIYPLIEPSEKLHLKSATEMHERFRSEIFPELRVGLVHGRMSSDEKDIILREFRDAKWDVLISTTVVEVGIDVPNATLMVVEHPERLGLSQLHQLRGRVGRGEKTSRCVLLASGQATERLKIMVKTDDGFEVAEEDLRLRGPGEFLGNRQSGLAGFRVGHLVRDSQLLEQARHAAVSILDKDPELSLPEHHLLRSIIETRWREKLTRLGGG